MSRWEWAELMERVGGERAGESRERGRMMERAGV